MSAPTSILSGKKFDITIDRLCYQLIENHVDFSNTVLIGLQPRGVFLGNEIHQRLQQILKKDKLTYGTLDVTFHRDDFRSHEGPLIPSLMNIDFSIQDRKVVLIDDVLYTGRTIRAGLEALLDFGRPAKVELLVLVDRRFSRQLPIDADYVGLTVDTRATQKVRVSWLSNSDANNVWIWSE